MAAEYDLLENPNPNSDGIPQPLHPRIVSKGTITTDKIIKQVSLSCSLTEGDMQAALSALTHYLTEYLKEGYYVELGDIGYFSPTLKSRPVMNKKEIRSVSVQFDNINFRAKKELRLNLRQGKLVRAQMGFKKSSHLSKEERWDLLEKHLEENLVITRFEYSQLTGRLKGMALKDINEWIEEGKLIARGKRNSRVYVIRK